MTRILPVALVASACGALGITACQAVAVFPPTGFTVSVTRTGAGIVTSSPPGITCGAVCTATFPAGTVVTLHATTADGVSFHAWSSPCAATTGDCVLPAVQEGATVGVAADFWHRLDLGYLPLTATDLVVSTPPGMSCPPACDPYLPAGSVRLRTEPPRYLRWDAGACLEGPGEGPGCDVSTVNGPAAIQAHDDVPAHQARWIRRVGTPNNEFAAQTAFLPDGGVAAAGSFRGAPVVLGDSAGTLPNAGLGDGLVVSYARNGFARWARRLGGTDEDHAATVCADPAGILVGGGAFSQDFQFDTVSVLMTEPLDSDAFYGGFLADGTQPSGFAYADDAVDSTTSMAHHPAGGFVAGGSSCSGSGALDPCTQAWVARVGAGGIDDWRVYAGSDGAVRIRDVAVAPDGSVYAIGDGQDLSSDTLRAPGDGVGIPIVGVDSFVVKLDPVSGTTIWRHYFTGGNTQQLFSVEVDRAGNVWLGGDHDNSLTSTVAGFSLPATAAMDLDPFLLSLTPAGNLRLFWRAGGATSEFLYDMKLVGTEPPSIAIAGGVFGGAGMNLGTGAGCQAGTTPVPRQSLVAVFTTSGTCQWGKIFGGAGANDTANGLDADVAGGLTVAGEANGVFTLDGQPFSGVGQDGYVLLISP